MKMLLFALCWTVCCEWVVYRFLLQRKEHQLDLCLINAVTNPLLNWGLVAAGVYLWPELMMWLLVCLMGEIVVVLVEWQLLKWLQVKKPLMISVILNLSSLVLGICVLLVIPALIRLLS